MSELVPGRHPGTLPPVQTLAAVTQDFDLINTVPPVRIFQEILGGKYHNFHHRSLGSGLYGWSVGNNVMLA